MCDVTRYNDIHVVSYYTYFIKCTVDNSFVVIAYIDHYNKDSFVLEQIFNIYEHQTSYIMLIT